MLIKCDECGKEFNKVPSLISRHKNHFCCRKCKNKWLAGKNIREYAKDMIVIDNKVVCICKQCNNEFLVYPSRLNGKQNTLFCSKTCRHNHDKERYVGKNNPNYKGGGQSICEYCGNTYSVIPYRKNITKFCSRICMDNWKREHPEVFINLLLNQSRSETKPEKIVREYLDNKGVAYISQYPMYDKFVVDFFLPFYNMVLEVHGDYFHANPRFYGTTDNLKSLSPRQKQKIGLDITKKQYLIKKGHLFNVIWEYDVYNNLDKSMNEIIPCND